MPTLSPSSASPLLPPFRPPGTPQAYLNEITSSFGAQPTPSPQVLVHLSDSLSSFLTYFLSGHLPLDHSTSQDSLLPLLLPLILDSPFKSLIVWSSIPPEQSNSLSLYFLSSSFASIHHPINLPRSARLLSASVSILRVSFPSSSRASISRQALPQALTLHLVLRQHPTYSAPANSLLDILLQMRHLPDLFSLIQFRFAPLHSVLLPFLHLDPDPYRHLSLPTPAEVIYTLVSFFTPESISPSHIPLFLDLILPLIESLDLESRHYSMRALQHLVLPMSAQSLHIHASRIAPVLRGGLVWRDAASAENAVAVYGKVLDGLRGTNGLIDDVHVEWQRGVKEMITTAERLSDSNTWKDVDSAVQVAKVVTAVMREKVLERDEWVSHLARFYGRLAMGVRLGKVNVDVMLDAGTVLREAIKWGWLAARTYRVDVMEGCVVAICETADLQNYDKDRVWSDVEKIVVQLGMCGQRRDMMAILKAISETSRHQSLRGAKLFFERINDKLSHMGEEHASNQRINAGICVRQAFPEIR